MPDTSGSVYPCVYSIAVPQGISTHARVHHHPFLTVPPRLPGPTRMVHADGPGVPVPGQCPGSARAGTLPPLHIHSLNQSVAGGPLRAHLLPLWRPARPGLAESGIRIGSSWALLAPIPVRRRRRCQDPYRCVLIWAGRRGRRRRQHRLLRHAARLPEIPYRQRSTRVRPGGRGLDLPEALCRAARGTAGRCVPRVPLGAPALLLSARPVVVPKCHFC